MNIYKNNALRRPHIIALLLIVLIPVVLIVWATLWYERYAQAQQARAVDNLIAGRLNDVSLVTHRYFEDLKTELARDRQQITTDHTVIRQMLRQATHIRQVFILDSNSQLQWPNPRYPLSQAETELISRLGLIWKEKRLLELAMVGQEKGSSPGSNSNSFVQPSNTASKNLPKNSPRNPLNYSSNNVPSQSFKQQAIANNQYVPIGKSYQGFANQSIAEKFTHSVVRDGWYIWYANDEMIHIYWWLDNAGRIWGFELSPQRLMADLISIWPQGSTGAIEANVHIRDNQGQVIYQWGPYTPTENEPYRKMLPLPAPLASWQIEYYAPKAAASSSVYAISFAVLLGLFLALLGIYLYREQRRATVEARQQVSFVNQVSHELKTPLTSIRMYAEMLSSRIDDDPRAERYLGVINTEGERLSRLISNILSFSKSKRGSLQLHYANTNVPALLQHCIDQFAPTFAEQQLAINLHFTGAENNDGDMNDVSDMAAIDSDAVEQIMINLISNAEKYGQSNVDINATLLTNNSHPSLSITVRDYGPGVPKEHQDKIFADFFRVDSSLEQQASGSGIGLCIAKALAELHGGSLTYQAAQPGAQFVLTLALPQQSQTI